MRTILLVGSGGFIGAVLRYLVTTGVHRLLHYHIAFPYGTLTANVLGCLLIGLLGGLAESRQLFSPAARLFLFMGVLGGFTTFSTFGHDTYNLARDLSLLSALANVFLHLALGLGAVYAGHALARLL